MLGSATWSRALDTAIALGAVGGEATCGAAFTLLVGALRNATVASVLFGLALACTVDALAAFLADSVLAWHELRTEGPLPHSRDVSRH
jgi:hypothetical protein